MKLVLRTHHVILGAIVQAGLASLAMLFGSTLVPLPGLGRGTALSLLLALLGAILLGPTVAYAWPRHRTTPVRSPGVIAVVVVVLQLLPVPAVASIGLLLGTAEGWSYLGRLLWLLALLFATGVFVSAAYQGAAPAVYVLLCALVGRIDGVVQPWAWPMDVADPVVALCIGVIPFAIVCTSLAALGLHARPPDA